MKVFTYGQYIKYIHEVRLNAVLQLAEEGTEYNIESKNKNHAHDNLITNILKDKDEVIKLVNDFLEPKQIIRDKELIICKNNYISKKHNSKEFELVYKIKNKEVFFLITYQTTINNQISYKILNSCVNIIQEWNRNKKTGKNIIYPIIVPIVIYTGNKKWRIQKDCKEKNFGNYILERNKVNLEYNLIDINKLSNKFLMQKNSMFSYAMLIEKLEDKEEQKKLLEKIKNMENCENNF